MMPWLRRFFYSDDPIVKLLGGMMEPEAKMWREMLENEGIPAHTKARERKRRNVAMIDWLRRFFYSDAPIVRVTGGLLAPLLENGSAGT